ncbi:Macrocin-O-methyltransferase [Oxalobacteraceae bacterium]|jgi:O-methyltransferase
MQMTTTTADEVERKLRYATDGLFTFHNCDFIQEPRFQEAYRYGMVNGRPDLSIEWRVHVALWCASQCAAIEGDFVECGVHTGILAGSIMTWLDFDLIEDKKYYLLDTFEGIPVEQISNKEADLIEHMNRKYPIGDATYLMAKAKFKKWDNAKIIRGKVPDTLNQVESKKIAFLSIDMNVASAEIAAAEYFWPKLQPGGMILLDDYGWDAHIYQKLAFDEFAKHKSVNILSLPTGQGLLMKPSSPN